MRLWYFIVAALPVLTWALPGGAPDTICDSMAPRHGAASPQTSPAPYSIYPATDQVNQGSSLRLALSSPGSQIPFGGFMILARSSQPPYNVVGHFSPSDNGLAKLINCEGEGSTATHTSPASKNEIVLEWTPPDNFLGPVVFHATVAQDFSQFWVNFQSTPVEVVPRGALVRGGISTTRVPLTSARSNYLPETTTEAPQTDGFYDGCGMRKSCFGFPVNCVNTRSCTSVVAVTVEGERYQFDVKGIRNPAYVAVGLSEDALMGDDSVVECVHNNGNIDIFQSWTTARPYGASRQNVPQTGVTLLSGSFNNGVLNCAFTRDVITNVQGRVFDLIKNKYHLLVASGSSASATSVSFHDIGKEAASEPKFLSDVAGFTAASKLLLRLHGAFMLAAWVGTTSIGILLARYFKQTWVGSKLCGNDQWFTWHRSCMLLTWSLTMVAFVIIFVQLNGWSGENNPHAILGVVTTGLCFLQPIGAAFRPHPGTKRRPIFNWLHWLVGNAAHILAIVTIFFAVRLSKAELPEWMDWILVAYVAFHVFMHFVFSISGCVSDRQVNQRVNSFPMKDIGSARAPVPVDRRQDAPYRLQQRATQQPIPSIPFEKGLTHSSFRKILFSIYVVVIVLFVVAMIVIIVLAPIEDTWGEVRKVIMEN